MYVPPPQDHESYCHKQPPSVEDLGEISTYNTSSGTTPPDDKGTGIGKAADAYQKSDVIYRMKQALTLAMATRRDRRRHRRILQNAARWLRWFENSPHNGVDILLDLALEHDACMEALDILHVYRTWADEPLGTVLF